jgi:hypothetical protein
MTNLTFPVELIAQIETANADLLAYVAERAADVLANTSNAATLHPRPASDATPALLAADTQHHHADLLAAS